MGKRSAFGGPGFPDRVRLWWGAQPRTARTNALLFVVVGAVSLGLVWAAVSKDGARTPSFANANRPRLDVPVSVPTPTNVVDPGAAVTEPSTTAVPDPGPTSTTAGTVPAAPAVTSRPPATTAVPRPTAVATTVPTSDVIYVEVPVPPSVPGPEPTAPPMPSSRVPTTTTPTTAAPATSAPSTSPTSAAPPTTARSLLPPLPSIPGG